MVTARQVADFFLSKADDDAGDLISNLKLQKLLYYAQGFYLALNDKPLFEEEIYAWTHGPVVPSIYDEFKEHGQAGIPKPAESPTFDEETVGLLDEVYTVFGQFSAWKLRNMTHEEPPWKRTKSGQVISKDALREYFKTQVTCE